MLVPFFPLPNTVPSVPSTQADLALFLPSPTGRLEEYLGSMAKIQKAVEYFQDNSPDSPELNKVVRGQQGDVRGLGTPVPALVSGETELAERRVQNYIMQYKYYIII